MGRERRVLALLAHQRLERLGIALSPLAGFSPDAVEQALHGVRRRRHRVVELEMGIGLEAEQSGALGAQPHHLGDDRTVVAFALVLAPGGPGLEGLLPQVPPGREAQEGLDQRAPERHGMLARKTAFGGGLGGRVAQRLRQAGEVVLTVEDEQIILLVVEDVLAEARPERREALGDRRQPRPFGRPEPRAPAHEAAVGEVEHAGLLGVEAEAFASCEDRIDAGEESGIEPDRLPMPGEEGCDVALDLLQRLVGVGACEVPEYAAHPAQCAAGALQRPDDVVEAWLGGIGLDGVDLVAVFGDPALEGRPEVLRLDRPERRRRERCRPGLEQGVAGHPLTPPAARSRGVVLDRRSRRPAQARGPDVPGQARTASALRLAEGA